MNEREYPYRLHSHSTGISNISLTDTKDSVIKIDVWRHTYCLRYGKGRIYVLQFDCEYYWNI